VRKTALHDVSSTDTIQHLKLLIYNETDIAPCEQTLYFGDVLLDDSKAPLRSYNVIPDVTLSLVRVEGQEILDFEGLIFCFVLDTMKK